MSKILMKGNEAIAEAAIQAGCRFFFGYPITPQNQIPEYMSKRMPKIGGCFLQAESEVAAINMVYGAAAAGARVMTSSSSPGVSLKQEGISYIVGAQLPCVIVNIMRAGPGLGGIQSAQGDYFQATRGGGHGDYQMVVLAPASVDEAARLTQDAFDIADRYRNPVMVLADGIVGQMMEPCEISERAPAADLKRKDWAAGEADKPSRAIINSLYLDPPMLEKLNLEHQKKCAEMAKNEMRWEAEDIEGADVIAVAYGSIARITRGAARRLKEKGVKVGLIRPVTLWPFPGQAIADAANQQSVKGVAVVEMSMGQLVTDVQLHVKGAKPVEMLGHAGGVVPTMDEVADFLLRVKEGK